MDFMYDLVAFIVVVLLIYVMQKCETDRVSRFDSLWLQWLRRVAFVGTSLALLYSIFSTNWQLTCLVLVGASGIILFINAVAMHMRTPPVHGHGLRITWSGISHATARLISHFREFGR